MGRKINSSGGALKCVAKKTWTRIMHEHIRHDLVKAKEKISDKIMKEMELIYPSPKSKFMQRLDEAIERSNKEMNNEA